jgi:FkbM family methyltransferase
MKNLIKTIYSIIPLKKHFFLFLKFFYTPSQKIIKHLHFKGIIKVNVNEKAYFKMHHFGYQIENEIFWLGLENAWERESMKLWIKLCENSNNIIDVGANTGIYSLVARSINKNANIYAFEPVERVYQKLEMNINLNKYSINSFKKALSNFDGKGVIYDTNTEHTLSVTVNQDMSNNNSDKKITEIDCIKLDTFILKNNVKNIDLVKIDVEYHEPEVLAGFEEYLNIFQPTLLIEVLTDEIAEKINNSIKNIDYLYFNIDEIHGVKNTKTIEKSDFYNYLICKKEIAEHLGLI